MVQLCELKVSFQFYVAPYVFTNSALFDGFNPSMIPGMCLVIGCAPNLFVFLLDVSIFNAGVGYYMM